MQDLSTRPVKLSKYDSQAFLSQLLHSETNNITSLNSTEQERHYDARSYSEHSVNPSSKIDHCSNNLINNHDKDHDGHTEDNTENGDHDGHTEDNTENGDHDGHTESDTESGDHDGRTEIDTENGDHNGHTEIDTENGDHNGRTENDTENGDHNGHTEKVTSSISFDMYDPKSDGRGSKKTAISQLHLPIWAIYKILMCFLSQNKALTCMILLCIGVSIARSLETFNNYGVSLTINPNVPTINESVTFICTCHRDNTTFLWLINGWQVEGLRNSTSVDTGHLVIPAQEFNGSVVQCIVQDSGERFPSRNVTLQAQGLLAAVGSPSVDLVGTDILTAPFTLDISNVDPDTTYCVNVVNSTSSSTVLSECVITVTGFNFSILIGKVTTLAAQADQVTTLAAQTLTMMTNRKKRFYFQQIESNNNSSTNSEGPYDTVGCNKSSANPSLALYPLINNTINNHDDDVYSSDGAINEDCDDHTKKVTTSIVKRESKDSSLLKPSFVPKSLSLFALIFDLYDPQSDGRGSERTVISQHHRQTFYNISILFCLMLSYPQCEGNSSDMTAPYWNHSILYMQSNKLSIKNNHSSMMSVYERQMDFKIMYDLFYCLLLISCILFLLWYIVKLWIPLNDNAVQENDIGRGQAHPQMPRISAPSSLDPPSNSSTTTAPVPLFGYRDSCVKSTSLPAVSEYNYLVNSLEHTRPPSSLLGEGDDGDGDTYLSASDFNESEPIHSIITSVDSNGHLLVYQKTRKATQKAQLSLLILKKDNALTSERLDNPGDNLAVVGKAEYLEESDDDRYLHSQEQECIKSADQLKEKGKKVSYSGDLSNSVIPIHQVHKNNILENTLCVPNPPNQYPTSLKSYLPPPQSPSLMPSLELGCGFFTEVGYALSGCIAGPEEKFGVIEFIPSLSDNDNAGHSDPEPVVVDDDDSVHDNGLYPCCFDVPCTRLFLAQSGP